MDFDELKANKYASELDDKAFCWLLRAKMSTVCW